MAEGKSEASHHSQAPSDSLAWSDSLHPSGSSDPDPASFSQQAPAMGLQWTGLGNSHQRRTPLRPRPTVSLQEADLHSRFEQRSQPRSERSIQSCRYPGQCTARSVSGFLPRSLVKGIKPTTARLTLARKIAAITLTLWKKGENFDAEKLKSQEASVFHARRGLEVKQLFSTSGQRRTIFP